MKRGLSYYFLQCPIRTIFQQPLCMRNWCFEIFLRGNDLLWSLSIFTSVTVHDFTEQPPFISHSFSYKHLSSVFHCNCREASTSVGQSFSPFHALSRRMSQTFSTKFKRPRRTHKPRRIPLPREVAQRDFSSRVPIVISNKYKTYKYLCVDAYLYKYKSMYAWTYNVEAKVCVVFVSLVPRLTAININSIRDKYKNAN